MSLLSFSFWMSLAFVGFTYVGYPVTLWCLSQVSRRRSKIEASQPRDADLPRIALLIAAYNEESEIDHRIRNALAMDYPRDRFEIVIGSDGSKDATPQIVGRYSDRGVRLLDYSERRGKASVLNSAFAELNADIVLLSDANTHNDPQAARKLVRWFADPQVGAVCGRLELTDPATGRNAESLYWRYENFMKRCEGRIGALLGANGAIYAIRKQLYRPIPADTILDDFVIPLLARIRTGCSIVYDPEAIAWEETPEGIGSEFHRRCRIGAGGFQSIGMLWRLLDPRRGWVAFAFFCHKILRWLCPFLLIVLLASNVALLSDGQPFFRYLLAAQMGFYLASLLVALMPAGPKALKPLRLAAMFTGMNAALLVGFYRWLSGTQQANWRRTIRAAETDGGVR